MTTASAFVLGSYETGLGIVRALGRTGIPVHVIDHNRQHAAHSRYAASMRVCPRPSSDPDGFISRLYDLASAQPSKPVVFVSADEFLEPIAHARAKLAEVMHLNIPNAALLGRISDKRFQSALAEAAGIPVPITRTVDALDEIDAAIQAIPTPAFIKGRSAVEWRAAFGGSTKGYVVRSPSEFRATLERVIGKGVRALVQELIPGDATQHCKVSAYYSQHSEVIAAFTLRKKRQHPSDFGFGCVVESERLPELMDIGLRFMSHIGYTGTGSAEFKFDARDGQYKLIELNPRYWQQNALAERCGTHFALLEYDEMTDAPMRRVGPYRDGVKWVNIHADAETYRDLRAAGQLTTGSWLRSLRGEKVWSDFALDDPRPGLWAAAKTMRRISHMLVKAR